LRAIDKIFNKLKEFDNETYPEGVVPLFDRIEGTSFFPGGDGLWKYENDITDIRIGGIMVIGHNFDNVSGFKKSLALGSESLACPTWKNLRILFQEANIDLTSCYFTNAYMGLMNSQSNIGVFPGSKSSSFRKQCLDFLEYQISIQQPQTIITLGRFVPPLLAQLSIDLDQWKKVKSFNDLDQAEIQIIKHAHFCENQVISNIVTLTHPANRHLNIQKRKYKNLNGNDAELAMLREILF